MKYKSMKDIAQDKYILVDVPVDKPSIFKGVCLNIEKNGKDSVAYTLFYNLVKLADNYKLGISFNCCDYSSIIVYSFGEPDKDQIDSIPLMDMTIRGMLQVIDTTLDYLVYIEEEPRPIFVKDREVYSTDTEKYLFNLLKEGVMSQWK